VSPTLRSNRARALLLRLGALAVMLHALAGPGLLRARAATTDGSFATGICTAAGFINATHTHSHPGDHRNHHDCCNLCAASGPALLTDISLAVPPAPTFFATMRLAATPRAIGFASPSPPPRGPPSLS